MHLISSSVVTLHNDIHFRDTKLHSYHWLWDDTIKLIDNQPCKEDGAKLSKTDVLEYLNRIMPHR